MTNPPLDGADLERERHALIAQIRSDFSDVSRAGGVSWSETGVIDNDGTDEECFAARSSDTDRHWTDLIDDPGWSPEVLLGGFSFLDPIGARYYLPASMVRTLKQDSTFSMLSSVLTVRCQDGRVEACIRERYGQLTAPQAKCLARFLRFMIAAAEAQEGEIEADCWREALDSYRGALG